MREGTDGPFWVVFCFFFVLFCLFVFLARWILFCLSLIRTIFRSFSFFSFNFSFFLGGGLFLGQLVGVLFCYFLFVCFFALFVFGFFLT